MKALVCHKLGPVESHKIRPWPDRQLGPTDVRVQIAYAGVNFPDTLIVQGLYQVKPQLPFIPGHECSGIVSEVGSAVHHLKTGDRVFVSTGTGGFAEHVIVPWHFAHRLPDSVPLDVAACITVTYGTALHALRDTAQLQEGETVLVLGASGGVGSAAVEIAKAMGATVIAAASTQEKCDYCKELGADHVINYTTESLRDSVKELGGADVVIDPVGGLHAETALRSLNYRGRYCVVGFAGGAIPTIPLNLALLNERRIFGVENKSWSHRNPQEYKTSLSILVNWIKMGKLNPKITARYSLDESVAALQHLQNRNALGKTIVEVDSKLV